MPAKVKSIVLTVIFVLCRGPAFATAADEGSIRVDVNDSGRPVSRLLTGACIEDVNHEIYGGIYSQMLFGESFQEPARGNPVEGFSAVDGQWRVSQGEVWGEPGAGPKLLAPLEPFVTGEAGVEIFLSGNSGGNGGLIVRVDKAGAGADNFDGYEIAFDVARKTLMLGRHQHDFRMLKEVSCNVAADRWVALSVAFAEHEIRASINGELVLEFTDDRPLPPGTVGLRLWQRPARFRNFWVKQGAQRRDFKFTAPQAPAVSVSGMWRPFSTGTAQLAASVEAKSPFVGSQSQRMAFIEGQGSAGIENQGLNRWGLSLIAARPYEGFLWARSEKPTELTVALESHDGFHRYAEQKLTLDPGEWRKLPFELIPNGSDAKARFSVSLTAPGACQFGYALLQPGVWGRFKGLPLRRDVVEGLIDQGVTVLRYGGSMVNCPEYRWKKMIGPRDRRPPYRGTWYPYSTNGWGIVDFLDLCDAAGFVAIPAFCADETPQDMADFVEYAKGTVDSQWGARRAADGRPQPYPLKYLEIGNEERIDEAYYQKFRATAEAIWKIDPEIILVVGDFVYNQPIVDPFQFAGAESRITSLAAHHQILKLAKEHDREVWFDVHISTDGPGIAPTSVTLPTYVDALEKIADGAKFRVAVFELNSGNPRHRRALGNALALGRAIRDGRYPVVTSANCLQPDGQNDNGWDQGLLFLNPVQVWLQPPGYVTQMLSRNYQPRVVAAQVVGAPSGFEITATTSNDRKTAVLFGVNPGDKPYSARVELTGYQLASREVAIEELVGDLDDFNTAVAPTRVRPRTSRVKFDRETGLIHHTFPPRSVTVMRIR